MAKEGTGSLSRMRRRLLTRAARASLDWVRGGRRLWSLGDAAEVVCSLFCSPPGMSWAQQCVVKHQNSTGGSLRARRQSGPACCRMPRRRSVSDEVGAACAAARASSAPAPPATSTTTCSPHLFPSPTSIVLSLLHDLTPHTIVAAAPCLSLSREKEDQQRCRATSLRAASSSTREARTMPR